MLSPMRYKTFTWPHNPRTYSIEFQRDTAVHKVPMGAYTMQDLGRSFRTLRGEGEFFGPDAYATFQALACLFYESGPGVLIHPVWQTSNAYFTELELQQEPREDYVRYRFAFREGYDGYAGLRKVNEAGNEAEQHVTLSEGDTLLAVARRAGIALSELLKLNPAIGNPIRVSAGQKVRIR